LVEAAVNGQMDSRFGVEFVCGLGQVAKYCD